MPRRTGRLLVLACLLATTASGCVLTSSEQAASGLPVAVVDAPEPAATPSPRAPLDAVREDVERTLDAVAAAFLDADPEALHPWLADPDGDFGARWVARAANLAGVPLTTYTLALDTSAADLTTSAVPGGDGLLVNVVEEHQLEGMEELGPLREHLFLTLRPGEDGRWLVAADTDGERLGLVSADHLWDHGPVVVTRRGALLALHHPEQGGIQTLLDEATSALATTDQRWPLPWPQTVPLLVPRNQEELAELLHVTYDLDNFIAFATSTPINHLGDVVLSGSRVMLNTERFLERPSATRERILVHELVHAASRPSSTPDVPSWLEEGVAQALGEQQSTTGTALLRDLAATDWDGALPLDAEFNVGARDDIFVSYQRAWSFVDWLVDEYGAERVGAFYVAGGKDAARSPGTAAARIDAAAVATFDTSLADLVARWRAAL